jgi:hypothetical protein
VTREIEEEGLEEVDKSVDLKVDDTEFVLQALS